MNEIKAVNKMDRDELKKVARLFFRPGHMAEDIATNVAVVLLSILSLLMVLSTAYSLNH